MVSRRDCLLFGESALAGVAGCANGSGGSTPDETGRSGAPAMSGTTPTETPAGPLVADGPTRTPGDVPEPTPTWTRGFGGRNVLGLDAGADGLYATTGADGGPAAVAAVAPGDGAPEDLLLAGALAVPTLVHAGERLRTAVAVLLVVSAGYALVRKQVVAVTEAVVRALPAPVVARLPDRLTEDVV